MHAWKCMHQSKYWNWLCPKGKMKLETAKGTIQEHNNGAIYNKLSGTFDKKNENL